MFDPGKPFRMSQDRHETGRERTKGKVEKPGRHHVVRRLEEKIAGIPKGWR